MSDIHSEQGRDNVTSIDIRIYTSSTRQDIFHRLKHVSSLNIRSSNIALFCSTLFKIHLLVLHIGFKPCFKDERIRLRSLPLDIKAQKVNYDEYK